MQFATMLIHGLRALARNRFRSSLTTLGIAIGTGGDLKAPSIH